MAENDLHAELMAHTRADLNAAAAQAGIENADQLPNKTAVVDAIVAAKAEKSATRAFRLKQDAGVTRLSFGASPRISIGAGETYSTSDPRLAARLAANPKFEEVMTP